MRPFRLAMWMPFALSALALHLLVAALGFSARTECELHAPQPVPNFYLVSRTYDLSCDEVVLPPEHIICARPHYAPEAVEMLPEIEDEIRAIGRGHAWAGDYTRGSGMHMALAPEHGAWAERGLGAKIGEVCASSHRILLALDEYESTEFLVVHWGPRHYLVGADEWDDFDRAVSSGEEPRCTPAGRFYLREGDELLPAEGRPELMGSAR